MRLQPLLEGEDRKDQLALQQNLLDTLDYIDATFKRDHVAVTFDHYEDGELQVYLRPAKGISSAYTVEVEGLNQPRRMLRFDEPIMSPSDPNIAHQIIDYAIQHLGEMYRREMHDTAATHAVERKWSLGKTPSPEDPEYYDPFPYTPPYGTNVANKIGRAVIRGLKPVCQAVMKPGADRKADPIKCTKAINDFNDDVLRKSPRPTQLDMGTDSDTTWFIYAPKTAN